MIKFLTAAVLAAVAVAAPAFADPAASSVKVSYTGLDLVNPAGRAEFDRRIARAVTQVCNVDNSLEMRAEVQHCRTAAFTSAKAQQQVAFEAAEGQRSVLIASR